MGIKDYLNKFKNGKNKGLVKGNKGNLVTQEEKAAEDARLAKEAQEDLKRRLAFEKGKKDSKDIRDMLAQRQKEMLANERNQYSNSRKSTSRVNKPSKASQSKTSRPEQKPSNTISNNSQSEAEKIAKARENIKIDVPLSGGFTIDD